MAIAAIAGYLEKVTRMGNKIAVFFSTMTGIYMELFNSVNEALRWIEETNLNTEGAEYDLDW